MPGGHEGSHDIGPVLRRRVVIKPVVKLLAPRPLGPDYPPPPLGPVAPVRVGDTVELELVEDEALNEAFWAPARITSIDLQGAFSAKIYAPGSVWHAWIEKGYLPKAEGVEWRRAAPRVLRFTHGTDLSSTLLGRVQAAARRQQARVTGSVTRPVAAPMRKAVKKPKLSKLHDRLLVKLRFGCTLLARRCSPLLVRARCHGHGQNRKTRAWWRCYAVWCSVGLATSCTPPCGKRLHRSSLPALACPRGQSMLCISVIWGSKRRNSSWMPQSQSRQVVSTSL